MMRHEGCDMGPLSMLQNFKAVFAGVDGFLRGQSGAGMLVVVSFMALAVPIVTSTLSFSVSMARNSQVSSEILDSQYVDVGLREYIKKVSLDASTWEGILDSGTQAPFTLNGEQITYTASKQLPSLPNDACFPALAGTEVVGDLTVQGGQQCTLLNAVVTGNILVDPGGSVAVLGSELQGDMQTDDASWVIVDCSGPGCSADSITATACSSALRTSSGCMSVVPSSGIDTAAAPITKTTIDGNLQVTGTTGVPSGFNSNYICNGTTIGGDLQLVGNSAPFEVGGRLICNAFGIAQSGNTINGNVQIKDNSVASLPAATFSDNLVSGSVQCSNNSLPVIGTPGCPGGEGEDD